MGFFSLGNRATLIPVTPETIQNIQKTSQYSAEIASPKQVSNQTTHARSIQLFLLPSMHKFYSKYFLYKSFQYYVITSNK